RLPERPLSSLYDEMISHGCKLSEQGVSPLKCEGQLSSGIYTLPGNITSQFISGLLFALPLLSGNSTINVTGILESRSYVDMTLDTLRLFGVTVLEKKQSFHITGGQTIRSPKNVQAEGDWSNAAFWLCAGAMGKSTDSKTVAGNKVATTCTGLDLNSRQGDRAILEILSRFGANVVCDKDTVTVSPNELRGIDIDAGDIPDLVPVLAAVAATAQGKTVIRNAARLRMKESDRLQTVAATLSAFGADITETEDGLVIIGKKTLKGAQTHSYGDHRIAMTAAVLSTVCDGIVTIKDAHAVKKSYPAFIEDFEKVLGGSVTVNE
ncbi:MAG: 3-phosphoshikimate 1-carboxyvinyltransferase, partial [Treponema sp.]|nr:3-phosphoshikimate 1-carboxyvinyltransferase [Treponema sp.]